MAVFIKIRNRFGLLISILIFFALALFVLQAAFNSNSSLLKGHSNTIGVIDGESVSAQEFFAKVDTIIDNYKQQNPKATLDDQATFGVRDKVWNDLITTTINQKEYDELGIAVSDAEYKDMFEGIDPNPLVRQQFTDRQTGLFNPQSVSNYIYNLSNAKPQNDEQAKQIATATEQWAGFEQSVKEDELQRKFKDLIKKAIYVPKWQAQLAYDSRANRADFHYVSVPYFSIPDSSVKITDDDLNNYIKTHKEKFKQDEETRTIQFVAFNVIPSSDDSSDAKKFINDAFAKLEAAPGDTNVLKEEADNPNDIIYYPKTRVKTDMMKDTLFKLPLGSLIGPFYENDSFKIIKILDRQDIPDSVKVKHILFKVAEDGSDSAKEFKKADSVYQLIKDNKIDYDTAAAKFSDEKETGKNGGELGWVKQGQLVKAFNNFLFFEKAKAGTMKLVKTNFGYHIVKIEDVSPDNPAVKLAYITRRLDASNTTDKNIFSAATNFALKQNTDTLFKSAARAQKLQLYLGNDLKINDYNVPNLGVDRDIVKWAYGAKVGEVSPVYSSDNKYIVAILESINPKGVQPLSAVKQGIVFEVRKEKKAALLISKLVIPCALNASLESLAANTNGKVNEAKNATLGGQYIPGVGSDPKLAGAIFGLKQGQLSMPIAGDNAVYVVVLDSISSAKPIADYSMMQNQLAAQQSGAIDYKMDDAVKKSLKIEDYRYNFF